MIYDEIQEMIKNVFAARAKNISDKVVSVWAREISSRGFVDLALRETEKELMEDDETDLTLPRMLAIIYRNNEKYKPKIKKIECEYCNGIGYVYSTLFFDKNGEYSDYRYGLKCYHNNNNDKCAKMVLNKETNNKTEINGGYVLVFKDISEREEYLEKVKQNEWKDLWVEKPKGDLQPYNPYPMGEGDTYVKPVVVVEKVEEDVIPDEDVPQDEDEETIPF